MSAIQAVALYTGINILVLALLCLPVVQNRNKKKISLGDGGDPQLNAAIRAHGNATEWVPAAMIGLAILALTGVGTLVIHALGASFTFARLYHAFGFLTGPTGGMGRRIGTTITLLVYLAIAGLLIWKAIS
jgi:uncharacterized membrane protein YecN with MAPEG domain